MLIYSHYPHPCALCSPRASNAFPRRTTARRSRFTSDRCHFDRERGCWCSWLQELRTISVGRSHEGAHNYGFDMTSSSTRASSSDTIRHKVWASSSWEPPDFIRDWSMISFFSEKKNSNDTTRGLWRSFNVAVRWVLTRFRVGPSTTPAVRAVMPLAVQVGTVPAVCPFTSSIVRHATPPAVRVVALPAVRGVTPVAFSGMASLGLVQPSLALCGWTTAVGKKTVASMTVASMTVGPRMIVSVIGGRTDDGMFTSMGAVCDKSVTFSQFPLSGLHSRRRSRDLSMVPVEVVDRYPLSLIARDI